jgi:hypothetical protein
VNAAEHTIKIKDIARMSTLIWYLAISVAVPESGIKRTKMTMNIGMKIPPSNILGSFLNITRSRPAGWR